MAKDMNGVEIPSFAEASAGLNKVASAQTPRSVIAQDGAQIPVEDDKDLSRAILSDSYSVNPDEVFSVKKFDGTTGQVQGKDIKQVLSSGDYMLESKEETQLREDEKAYGANNLEAASLGAARGLTFGLSDQFLKGSGSYTADELRGTENANPIASIGGEVAGAILPAIASGGTSLAARGATTLGAGVLASEAAGAAVAKNIAGRIAEKQLVRKTALEAGEKLAASEAATVVNVANEANQAMKAGASAVSDDVAAKSASLFAKSLEKSGYAASQAKSIANKMLYDGLEHMAPGAANLAVQGALQGAGRLVTEDAFGTAEFNAENLIAYAGLGSLVGGTFGAALGAGKALAPKISELAKPVVDSVSEFGAKFADPERAALRMTEISPSQLSKIEKFQPDFVKQNAEILSDVLKKNPGIKDNPQLQEALLAERELFGSKIGNVLEEADSLAAAHSPALQTSIDPIQRKLMRAGDEFIDSLSAGNTPGQIEAARGYLDNYITGLGKRLGVDTPITTKLMQAEKKALADKAFKSAMPTSEELSIKGLQRRLAEIYSAEQEFVIKNVAEYRQGVGNIVDDYAKFKKGYQTLSSSTKNSDKLIAKELIDPALWDDIGTKDIAAGVVFGGMTAAVIKAAKEAINSHTFQKHIVMGSIEKSSRAAAAGISSGLKGMGKGVAVAAKAAEPSVVRSLVSSQLAVKTVDGKKQKPKNEEEAYNNIIENANKAVTDPESVLQQSNRQTAAMFAHAPNTAAAIDAKYLQMMQFIASKTKKSNKKTGIFDIGKSVKPSGFEMAKIARYVDAISNPQSMLSKAAQGKLSREHVEVMSNLFPEMHNKLKEATLKHISENKTEMKYAQKLQLGLLLGLQAHESMQPQNIQALQSQFNSADSETAGDTSYNQGAVGDMSKSSNMASDTEQHEIGD
jgi:hypothetical protein